MNAPAPSLSPDFSHITTWVFDLDNTLYPAHCNLFKQIDARMTGFVERTLDLPYDQARTLQKDYYVRYGTTLSGLMREHDVAPHDFMDYVHDIDLAPVDENPVLAALIDTLPGEKYIFTNGSVRHAENVTTKLGLSGLFDAIFDIAAADFTPKPHRIAYERFTARHAIDPRKAAMFEDIAHNLAEPHAMGMATVLITSNAEWLADEPADKRPAAPLGDGAHLEDYIHHVTDDLTAFLQAVAISHNKMTGLEPNAAAR